MAKTGNYDIPFDKDGNQMHYPERWREHVMVPNFTFEDTLFFKSMARGRSAAYFHFIRQSTGKDVIVFMTDLCDFIPLMNAGRITATFTFRKRGANFGCVLHHD